MKHANALWIGLLVTPALALSATKFPSVDAKDYPATLHIQSLIEMCASDAGYYVGMARLRNQGVTVEAAIERMLPAYPRIDNAEMRATLGELWLRRRYDDDRSISADLETIGQIAFNRCLNRNNTHLPVRYRPDSFR